MYGYIRGPWEREMIHVEKGDKNKDTAKKTKDKGQRTKVHAPQEVRRHQRSSPRAVRWNLYRTTTVVVNLYSPPFTVSLVVRAASRSSSLVWASGLGALGSTGAFRSSVASFPTH
jgi:hypothetical protein